MSLLAAAVCLFLASPSHANALTPKTTDAESADARRLLESHNGAGARGCLDEKRVYEAYHRVDGAMAWNPDNPVDWYVGRNTIGLFEALVLTGYGEASRDWNSAVNGTNFEAIGEPCRAARSPRALAACFDDRVHAYFDAHPKIRPALGGACKMYSATVVAVSSHYPAVTRQASIVASAQHAFNKLSIRDAEGREHVFLIDALNNLVVQLADAKGGCPDEGTLAPPPASADEARAKAREAAAAERARQAGERVGRAEASAPAL